MMSTLTGLNIYKKLQKNKKNHDVDTDGPQDLQKMPPKRYQSPSRCGSPSIEAPDNLLFRNH